MRALPSWSGPPVGGGRGTGAAAPTRGRRGGGGGARGAGGWGAGTGGRRSHEGAAGGGRVVAGQGDLAGGYARARLVVTLGGRLARSGSRPRSRTSWPGGRRAPNPVRAGSGRAARNACRGRGKRTPGPASACARRGPPGGP